MRFHPTVVFWLLSTYFLFTSNKTNSFSVANNTDSLKHLFLKMEKKVFQITTLH